MSKPLASKVLFYFSETPHDKLLHIVGGLVGFMVAVVLMPPVWALAVAVIVGGLKEGYDWCNPDEHTPDRWDALATAAAASTSAALFDAMARMSLTIAQGDTE